MMVQEVVITRFRKWIAGLYLASLVALAGVLHFFEWNQIESSLIAIPYRCPLKWVTGLQCAFCGMTHSWIALLKGDFSESFHFNQLGIFVFTSSVVFAVAVLLGREPKQIFKPVYIYVAIGVLFVFAVVRNFF